MGNAAHRESHEHSSFRETTIKQLLDAGTDALSCPSHRRFAQQRIGHEGKEGIIHSNRVLTFS
jgi:hypothetical protein